MNWYSSSTVPPNKVGETLWNEPKTLVWKDQKEDSVTDEETEETTMKE